MRLSNLIRYGRPCLPWRGLLRTRGLRRAESPVVRWTDAWPLPDTFWQWPPPRAVHCQHPLAFRIRFMRFEARGSAGAASGGYYLRVTRDGPLRGHSRAPTALDRINEPSVAPTVPLLRLAHGPRPSVAAVSTPCWPRLTGRQSRQPSELETPGPSVAPAGHGAGSRARPSVTVWHQKT